MQDSAQTDAHTVENPPAFPAVGEVYGKEGDPRWAPGMSLRDYFAAAVVQGCFAEGAQRLIAEEVKATPDSLLLASEEDVAECVNALIARMAYGMADAMLKARVS